MATIESTHEEWLNTEKTKIYENTTTEALEKTKADIIEKEAEIKAAMSKAEEQKKEYLKKGNLTKALEADGVVRDKEAELDTLAQYIASIGFMPPMTKDAFIQFSTEISNHYSSLFVEKYTELKTMVERCHEICDELEAYNVERYDLRDYLRNMAGVECAPGVNRPGFEEFGRNTFTKECEHISERFKLNGAVDSVYDFINRKLWLLNH